MTSINHSNNLCLVTLNYPSSTPPSSSTASSSSPSSTSWTKKIEQKIQELKKQLDDPKNHKEAKNGYLPEQDSKSLDSLPTQLTSLETVSKLAEFADELDTSKYPSNNILNNLCTGLEKFLGFDPTSKGYNGTGIVYSDLDRLCDGVMGFLSGVLSNIKEHLGQHKTKINDAITSLEQNKHAGKKGFNVAIESVVAGVRGYNDGVAVSNNLVKKAIEKLQKDVGENFTESLKTVLPERRTQGKKIENTDEEVKQAVGQIDAKLEECKQNAHTFITNLDTESSSIKDAINDLNSDLKIKLENVRRTVEYESERLGRVKVQEEREFNATRGKVSEVLQSLTISVDCKIDEQVRQLVTRIKEKVNEIIKELNTIYGSLGDNIDQLQQRINESDGAVVKVKETVNKIVNGSLAYEKNEWIKRKANDLITWRNDIARYVDEVTDMAKNVKDAVTEVGKQFDGRTTINNVFDKIKGDVDDISGYVGESSGAGSIIGTDPSIQQNWDALKNKITELVGNLFTNHPNGDRLNCIGKINKGVAAYAALFEKGERVFGKIVDGWVTDVLKTHSVKMHIEWYTGDNERKTYFNGRMRGQSTSVLAAYVTEIVKRNINEAVNKIDPPTDFSASSTVESYLSYVNSYLMSFSREIINKEDEIVRFVEGEIKYDTQLVASGDRGGHRPHHLRLSIRATLAALSYVAKHVAGQLNSFASDETNLHANLTAAIKQVDLIGQQFGTGDSFGSKIDGALSTVQLAIRTLHSQLEKATGTKGATENFAGKLDEAINALTNRSIELTASGINTGLTHISTEITASLRHILKAFEQTGNAIQQQLTSFRNNKIGMTTSSKVAHGSLQELHNKFSQLQSSLQSGPIQKTNELVTLLTAAETKFPELLKDEIHKNIQKAEAALTTHARRAYVESVKFLLTEFAAKVTGELRDLPEAISAELNKGNKKFMKKLATYIEPLDNQDVATTITTLSTKVCHVFRNFVDCVDEDVKLYKKGFFQPADFKKYIDRLASTLNYHGHFSHEVANRVTKLSGKVAGLRPLELPDAGRYVIGAVKKGWEEFVEELENQYVSRYSMQDWATVDEEKYSKVLCTILGILLGSLRTLREGLDDKKTSWKSYTIYRTKTSRNTLHGLFLDEHGYDSDRSADAFHGELNHKKNFTGEKINDLLDVPFTLSEDECLKEWKIEQQKTDMKLVDILEYLYYQIQLYYAVCNRRHIPKPMAPTTIYQMLTWLTGLSHTAVYADLTLNGFEDLFEKPETPAPKEVKEGHISVDEEKEASLEASPHSISPTTLFSTLQNVCAYAETVLVAILGHGHAGGRYACDFNTNRNNLEYPSDAGKCVDMLVDISHRVFHQLRFLCEQCSNSRTYSGWAECWYGQGVGGSSWKCNALQRPNQICDQRVNQIANQIADQKVKQTCKQHPKCGLKSPLQSFLEDGLVGFLPHSISKPGCKLECSLSKHRGIPCKTPMGFGDISITASHTSSGSRLYRALKTFCGTPSSPLTLLCSALTCVMNRPPQTLGDIFGFFQSFLYEWSHSGAHRKEAFDDAVNNANFKRRYANLNAHNLFHSTHSSRIGNHGKGDLVSLVCSSKSRLPCGPYLRSLSHDISGSFSMKHADKYVSWVVHIAGTLYDLLKKLYDDCNKSCGGDRPKCRIAKCSPTCNVGKQYGTPSHDSKCSSIVNCQSTASVLCTYGFIYSDRMSLSGTKTTEGIRTCKDLCEMLKTVLEEESVLMKLFHSIDKFIYTIRFPFMTLTLALWLLSLLYLLHIMVIRLDLLHIKSHLHSPSSHRIAAQSLLAAARVNNLNRVFYLQP